VIVIVSGVGFWMITAPSRIYLGFAEGSWLRGNATSGTCSCGVGRRRPPRFENLSSAGLLPRLAMARQWQRNDTSTMKRAAAIRALLLVSSTVLPPGVHAQSQANSQFWADVTLGWVKSPRLTPPRGRYGSESRNGPLWADKRNFANGGSTA